MNDDERWEAWCADFDAVVHELTTLAHTRYMWRTILAMLERSVPHEQQYNVVQNYLIRTYATTIATAIRREADQDARTSSLARCLMALVKQPGFASRSRYLSLIEDPEIRAKLSSGFDLFAPSDREYVDPRIVEADLAHLHDASVPVKKYTNKVIAHRERRNLEQERLDVSFADLNAALDAIFTIAKKYYRLRHPATELMQFTPVVDLRFLNMFSVPWFTPGQPLPDDGDMG